MTAIALPTWRDRFYQKGPACMYVTPNFAREVRNGLKRLTLDQYFRKYPTTVQEKRNGQWVTLRCEIARPPRGGCWSEPPVPVKLMTDRQRVVALGKELTRLRRGS